MGEFPLRNNITMVESSKTVNGGVFTSNRILTEKGNNGNF